MFSSVSRADESVLGRWWWSVDRTTLLLVCFLIVIGLFMSITASPAVTQHTSKGMFTFVQKHILFLPLAIGLLLFISAMSVRTTRILAFVAMGVSLALLVAVLLVGSEFNGSRRWIDFGFFTLQPTELAKPCFAVVSAWLLSRQRSHPETRGAIVALVLYIAVMVLLLLQTDLSQSGLITAIFFAQLFLLGVSLWWFVVLIPAGLGVVGFAYLTVPYVYSRVNGFFWGGADDKYQVEKSIAAFKNGNWFGRGPGEGIQKDALPDAHTDFILAVVGEEFGLFACLVVVGILLIIIMRGVFRASYARSLFILLAIGGLLTQFGTQAFINMSTTLGMMIPTGMTLPFISYGGSSLIGMGLTVGFLLSLSRRGAWENDPRH